jgi:hypothetical protein
MHRNVTHVAGRLRLRLRSVVPVAVTSLALAASHAGVAAGAELLVSSPLPTPGQSVPLQPGDPVSAMSASPLTLRSATLRGRVLRVHVLCEPGSPQRVTLLSGHPAHARASGRARLACSAGRAEFAMKLLPSLARAIRGGRTPAILKAERHGEAPVLLPLGLGVGHRIGAHAADYGFNWDTAATCVTGALWGDPGSLTISIDNTDGYGAPIGSKIYWRSWVYVNNVGWRASPDGFWSYSYYPQDTESYVDASGFWHYGGSQAPGMWMSPQWWGVTHAWVRPAIEIRVPATGAVYFYYVPVGNYNLAGAGPGVAFSQPNWCGFGV